MNEGIAKVLEYVLARLKEPSTWAGIAVFIGAFGVNQGSIDKMVENGPAMAVAAASLVAILAPSRAKHTTIVVPPAEDVDPLNPAGK